MGSPRVSCGAWGLDEFGNSLSLEVATEPIGHAGIVDGPRIFFVFAFFPVTFVTIEELVPVALVLDYGVAFETVLVPVVVLLSVPVPFLGSVDDHGVPFVYAHMCAMNMTWPMACKTLTATAQASSATSRRSIHFSSRLLSAPEKPVRVFLSIACGLCSICCSVSVANDTAKLATEPRSGRCGPSWPQCPQARQA